MTSKSIGANYSLGTSTLSSLATFKQRDQEILRGNLFKEQKLDLDLWPCDLKMNRVVYSLGASGNFQANGSRDLADITWSTDRLVQNIFFKSSHKNGSRNLLSYCMSFSAMTLLTFFRSEGTIPDKGCCVKCLSANLTTWNKKPNCIKFKDVSSCYQTYLTFFVKYIYSVVSKHLA